ncbi:hypothetical protein BJ912DRAFT_91307 [Pholiota molesta]|nr:hypothetical protein BJ912DRAFT_91307 [Pholiota molesta]
MEQTCSSIWMDGTQPFAERPLCYPPCFGVDKPQPMEDGNRRSLLVWIGKCAAHCLPLARSLEPSNPNPWVLASDVENTPPPPIRPYIYLPLHPHARALSAHRSALSPDEPIYPWIHPALHRRVSCIVRARILVPAYGHVPAIVPASTPDRAHPQRLAAVPHAHARTRPVEVDACTTRAPSASSAMVHPAASRSLCGGPTFHGPSIHDGAADPASVRGRQYGRQHGLRRTYPLWMSVLKTCRG